MLLPDHLSISLHYDLLLDMDRWYREGSEFVIIALIIQDLIIIRYLEAMDIIMIMQRLDRHLHYQELSHHHYHLIHLNCLQVLLLKGLIQHKSADLYSHHHHSLCLRLSRYLAHRNKALITQSVHIYLIPHLHHYLVAQHPIRMDIHPLHYDQQSHDILSDQ